MPAPYMSEVAKVRDLPEVMKYITGRIADVGCGPDKITPDAIGFDGRPLDGVDVNREGCLLDNRWFDTIFSSHFLEHTPSMFEYIMDWYEHLESGGHIVLYLPDGRFYDNAANPEHLHNINSDDFMFWFRRTFCGEGKTFRGDYMPKLFEVVLHDQDIGRDRYSFYVVAKKL